MTGQPENVSVIVPAYNAAETLSVALASLLRQTFAGWEAVVVDDGSTDGTADVAGDFAARDPRIRVVRQIHRGAGVARDVGIDAARFNWLLFLDADDWLGADHLTELTGALSADPNLDAAYCAWARVTDTGQVLNEDFCEHTGDLFPLLTERCAFAIHSCVFRRSLLRSVGGFDRSLRTCEDWDLWQRIARAGANFGRVPKVLSYYRMRPDSASVDGYQMLRDGLRVIGRGHAPDPRVSQPLPSYAPGLAAEGLPTKRLLWMCWCAALTIGRGEDARGLLEAVRHDQDRGLEPLRVARYLYYGIPLPTCRLLSDWATLWQEHQERIDRFLEALESCSKADRLAHRVRVILERLVLDKTVSAYPLTIGMTHALRVEVSEPIPDIFPASSVQRVHCSVELEGEPVGDLQLPVCDAMVSRFVLRDAIAAKFGWTLLGRYFERTVYSRLHTRRESTGYALYRDMLPLIEKLDEELSREQLHDRIGWLVFLQELWARPCWDLQRFYTHDFREAPARHRAEGDWLSLEVSAELPDVHVPDRTLVVLLSVGGVPIGTFPVTSPSGRIDAHAIRATLTHQGGLELCWAAVREGLLGRPFVDGLSLRERLAESAARHAQPAVADREASAGRATTPGLKVLSELLPDMKNVLVLARRAPGELGNSASRWASLPTANAAELCDAARLAREPFVRIPRSLEHPKHVIYAPSLILVPALDGMSAASVEARNGARATALDVPTSLLEQPSATSSTTWHRLAHKIAQALKPGGNLLALDSGAGLTSAKSPPAADTPGANGRNADTAVTSDHLPILMYHRIADTGAAQTARWRLAPALFEAQLRCLREHDFYSITLEDWARAIGNHTPLRGRPVLMTFDDGYMDFYAYAWPLLKCYGFSATVFLVTDRVGQANRWDSDAGEQVPLMDWRQISELQAEGVQFGSHSASHRPLTGLSPEEIVDEVSRSRAALQRRLGTTVRAFAFPYGDFDPVVEHLVGASGYVYGLSCRPGFSGWQDSLLALPRIEISGATDLQEFKRRLELSAQPATARDP